MSKHPVILAFIAALAVFTYVHATPTFGDADAFYHLEMAKLTASEGPIRDFPWLPYTTLADHFADHHFLYHVALIPFLSSFGDPLGLKTATVVFGALAVAAFCFLLKDYGIRRPFVWTLPLILAPGFVFRILLTKSTPFALIVLLLSLIAMRREMRAALFALGFVYVWSHGSWPLLLVAAAFDGITRRSTRLVGPAAVGLAAGLVINPFFPSNVFFYWEQLVQIGIVGAKGYGVFVGSEWYPAEIGALLLNNWVLFLYVVAAIWLLARRVMRNAPPDVASQRRRHLMFAWALAATLMLMTVRQGRQKEYGLPILIFAAALLWDTLADPSGARASLARARNKLGRAFLPGAMVLAAAAVSLAGLEIRLMRDVMLERQPFSRFAAVGSWMHANVPSGEIVFHTAWDDFPLLFYRDPAHRYVAGLDPRFFHRKDPAMYWRWRDLSDGRVRIGLAEAIEREFGARYVFLETEDEPLLPLIRKDPSFERVYADVEAEVWRITR